MRVVALFLQKILSQNFQKAVIKGCEFIKGIEMVALSKLHVTETLKYV